MTRFIKRSILVIDLFICSLLVAAPVELIQGTLKLVLYPDTGSFSLYRLSEIGKGRYEALFDDRNFAATSWFSVLSNGRVFKLERKIGKPIVFERSETNARYTYTLTDDFQVVQDFSFVLEPATGATLGIRIDTVIENTSGKEGSFALKAVFDTNLGEGEGIHFYTDISNRISAETSLKEGVDADSWIVSKKKDLSLGFLLSGSLATKPSQVYIENWDRLNTLTWEPELIVGRSFNTVYSVNDSALLFVWPEKTLSANASMKVTVACGPASAGLLTLSRSSMPSSATSAAASSAAKAVTDILAVDSSTLDAKAKHALLQQLLTRVAEIKANPDSASDEELNRLNSAVDALLLQLGE